MAVVVRQKSLDYLENLIKRGNVDLDSDWSFEPDEENEIIEKKGFETFQNVHLAYDDEGNEEAKSTYKFPVAKLKGEDVVVFRRGVIAAKQRASQFGYDNVYRVADKLLQEIDEKFSENDEDREQDELQLRGKIEERRITTDRAIEDNTLDISFASDTPVNRGLYWEILRISEDAIVPDYFKHGGAVLYNHDPNELIGVVEKWYIQDGKARAIVRLSETAEKYRKLIQEGILRHVSVGYIILDTETVGERDGLPVILVRKWVPMEISFVALPADITVGVGRSVPKKEEKLEKIEVKNIEEKEERKMEDVLNTINPEKAINMTEKEKKEYSLLKALRELAEKGEITGFEKEVHDEIVRKTGRSVSGLAFYVPTDVLSTRAALSGTGFVETKIQGVEYAIREALVLKQAGAVVLEGLNGNVVFVKESTKPTAYWIDPSSPAATESTMAFQGVTASPKTLAIAQPVFKSLLSQTSQDVENYLRQAFMLQTAVAIDSAALIGSGSNGQPTGLLNTAGVNTITLTAAITRANILSALAYVEGYNLGKIGFVMNASAKKVLRSTPYDSTYPIYYLMDNQGLVEGYPSYITNVIPTAAGKTNIYLGDWSKLIVCFWDAIQITVDPYSKARLGQIDVVLNALVDVAITNPAAFVIIKDVTV